MLSYNSFASVLTIVIKDILMKNQNFDMQSKEIIFIFQMFFILTHF